MFYYTLMHLELDLILTYGSPNDEIVLKTKIAFYLFRLKSRYKSSA